MRKEIPFLLVAVSIFAPACFVASLTSDNGTAAECKADVTLQAGDRVQDLDPMAWLAQYWGSYQGTLVWAAGGQTTVDMTTAQEPGAPVTGQCLGGRIGAVYTYGNVVLASADGGLNATYSTIVGGALPGSPPASVSSSAFSVSGMPVSAQSPLASHMTVDFSRYSAESNVELLLEWPIGTGRPVGAKLIYEGYPLQAPGATDTILVATITFP
jgi:hypothetical protein